MHCPYCGKELEAGYLKSSHAVQWGRERSLWSAADDIRLSRLSVDALFDGFAVEAMRCGSCKKLIVFLEEEKS